MNVEVAKVPMEYVVEHGQSAAGMPYASSITDPVCDPDYPPVAFAPLRFPHHIGVTRVDHNMHDAAWLFGLKGSCPLVRQIHNISVDLVGTCR